MAHWKINVQPEWYDSSVQQDQCSQDILVRRADFAVVERTGSFRAFVIEAGKLTRYSFGSHANMAPGNYLRVEYYADPQDDPEDFDWIHIEPHADTVEIKGLMEWSGRAVLPMTQELFNQLMAEPIPCPD